MSTKNVLGLAVVYVVLPVVFFFGGNNSVSAEEVKGADGKTIQLEKKKRTAPNVRDYTTFYGMMGQDSVFRTKNDKYCLIKLSKNGKWYPVWLKQTK